MKTIPLAVSLLVLTAAAAGQSVDQSIDNLVAHCERVMSLPGDVCGVARDRRTYESDTIRFPGLGNLKTDAYLWIREPRYAQNADGTHVMCSRIREACSVAWNGPDDRCKAARWKWRSKR